MQVCMCVFIFLTGSVPVMVPWCGTADGEQADFDEVGPFFHFLLNNQAWLLHFLCIKNALLHWRQQCFLTQQQMRQVIVHFKNVCLVQSIVILFYNKTAGQREISFIRYWLILWPL